MTAQNSAGARRLPQGQGWSRKDSRRLRGSSARKPSQTARKERSRKPAKKMPAERAPPPRRTKKDPQGSHSYIRSSPSPARRERPPGNIRQKCHLDKRRLKIGKPESLFQMWDEDVVQV